MASIEEEFRNKGILRGRTLHFRPEDAIAVVRRCRERGIAIHGIDGFIITEHVTQPVMEQSMDLSDIASLRNPIDCWDRAERFLEDRRASDLYFEIVTGEHD